MGTKAHRSLGVETAPRPSEHGESLAGIKSRIPVDEVIGAMREVGEALPESLRETSLGGLANTPTGVRLRRKLA